MRIDLFLDICSVTVVEKENHDELEVTFWPEEEFTETLSKGKMTFNVDSGKGISYSRSVYNIEPDVIKVV